MICNDEGITYANVKINDSLHENKKNEYTKKKEKKKKKTLKGNKKRDYARIVLLSHIYGSSTTLKLALQAFNFFPHNFSSISSAEINIILILMKVEHLRAIRYYVGNYITQ